MREKEYSHLQRGKTTTDDEYNIYDEENPEVKDATLDPAGRGKRVFFRGKRPFYLLNREIAEAEKNTPRKGLS